METEEKYKTLKKLYNQKTRANIMARFGRFSNLEFADYAQAAVEKEDEILKFLFRTSDLVELGKRWGLLKDDKTVKPQKQKEIHEDNYGDRQ